MDASRGDSSPERLHDGVVQPELLERRAWAAAVDAAVVAACCLGLLISFSPLALSSSPSPDRAEPGEEPPRPD